MSTIIFVPRTRQEIDEHPDKKIPVDELQAMWGLRVGVLGRKGWEKKCAGTKDSYVPTKR